MEKMVEEEIRGDCGIGSCQPKFLRRFASIPWFICSYSITSVVTSSLTSYIVSQISTIEKQFGLSSVKTGYLMACNDIGYSVFILFASYMATRYHIPRFLSLSAALFGISGILCAVPHFLFIPKSIDEVGASVSVSRKSFAGPVLCINTTDVLDYTSSSKLQTNFTISPIEEPSSTSDSKGAVAMGFIAVGMIIQGMGKAPRPPMLAQYIDDNCNPRKTGFYMGIIASLAVVGPALSYGLGGLFSQMYVTLEDVDLHPRDPRWIGAWWLGFVVFGIIAIISSFPMLLFPKKMKIKPLEEKKPVPPEEESSIRAVWLAVLDMLKMMVEVIKNPPYVCMLLCNIINIIGFSAGMSFGPKFLEVHWNVPAYISNYILAIFTVVSICGGSFVGGIMTKKVNITPRKCALIMLIPQIPSIGFQFATLFMGCDQPQIQNWPNQDSKDLPGSCDSDCGCENKFLPVCDGMGNNYFSPCHAGCTNGSQLKFTNCSCTATGEVTTGLCDFECKTLIPYLTMNLLMMLVVSIMIMPAFIFNIRIVEDRLKAMSIGISHLCMSLFAWIPGPVIGGRLIDKACLLWSDNKNDAGYCMFYDINMLRQNIIGIALGCRTVAILLLGVISCYLWNMKKWPSLRGQQVDAGFKQRAQQAKQNPLLKTKNEEDAL